MPTADMKARIPNAPGGSGTPASSWDDSRVSAALEEYERLRRAGQRPERVEFLSRHAEIADALADCLDGLDLVRSAEGGFDSVPNGGGAEALWPPARLGDFRLLREIGRGGMGVVYEAEQVSLGRRVALKVLPSAASLDRRRRERFQVEAHAAALLHHEHIVPIFGVWCEEGIHYFAMQLIDGPSLAEVIRGLRPSSPGGGRLPSTVSAPGGPDPSGDPDGDDSLAMHVGPEPSAGSHPGGSSGSGSSPSAWSRQHCRTSARFGLQACEALEHAHAVGVIHRDIKPSNLLVDGRGHLWVMDFGLARTLQEDLGLTRTGDLVGTLRYMSPEQVRGDGAAIDPRADVYALGVTLYELLTLRPAFDVRDRQELIRRILEDEPVAPRRINASIPRDLETIVLKAMAKEPSARYGSARELGDDLRRFLDDQPIRARRPGLLERTARWSRRHRAAVVTASALLLLTLSTSTTLSWQAKRRAEADAYRLQQAKQRADATTERLKESLAAQILALQVSLGTLDQIARPLAGDARSDTPRGEEARRILPVALMYYDRIPKELSRAELTREPVAKAHRQAGHVRLSLGRPEGRRDYREAIRVYEELADRSPKLIWLRTGLLETLREYTGWLTAPEDSAEADAATGRACAVAESMIGNKEAGYPCFRKGLAVAFNNLAWELVRRPSERPDRLASAVRLGRQVVAWEAKEAKEAEQANGRNTQGVAHYFGWNTLGVAYYRTGDLDAAAAALEKSTALNRGGDANDWFFLAAIRHRQGRAEEARRLYDRAVAWMRQDPARSRDADLIRFQAEAAQVLEEPAPPRPKAAELDDVVAAAGASPGSAARGR
jgi:serine/threonine protein kinase/tetratricopeptide (TPR) repeat protein